MRVIAMFFGPCAPRALTSDLSVLSYNFKRLERFTKLATSSLIKTLCQGYNRRQEPVKVVTGIVWIIASEIVLPLEQCAIVPWKTFIPEYHVVAQDDVESMDPGAWALHALCSAGCHRVHRTSSSRNRGEWPHRLAGHRFPYRRPVGARHSTRSVHVYVGTARNPGDRPDVSAGGLQAHAPIYPNVASAVNYSLAASPAWRTPPALFLPLVYHCRL